MSLGNSCLDEPVDEGEEKFHPFIQSELETLNFSTQSVNTLEARLEETRILFIEINKERTTKLDEVVKKVGKCVEKARPYYEAVARRKVLQKDVQRAAQMFERACSTVDAAKEMVQLAEQSVINIGTLDGSWQEVLNHATERVFQAEKDKQESERTHRIYAEELSKVALSCNSFERTIKNCIGKSAVYFDLSQSYNEKLETKKAEIRELENSLNSAKQTYSLALGTLENISNIIHKRRQAIREKQLRQGSGETTPEESPDPLLLDVPDLIRQLHVSSPKTTALDKNDSDDIATSRQTSIKSSQSTYVLSSGSTVSSISNTSSSNFNYSSSTIRPSLPIPLKNNTNLHFHSGSVPLGMPTAKAAIRAGVVISAEDLLRSVGLLHLANNVPSSSSPAQQQQRQYQQQQQRQQQQQKQQHPLSKMLKKGLTSSSSSYSLPTQQTSPSTASRSGHSTYQSGQTDSAIKTRPFPPSAGNNSANDSANPGGNVVSWPSPSLSEVSSASSTTGGPHRHSHRRLFQKTNSERSSENEEDNIAMRCSENDNSDNGNKAKSSNSSNGGEIVIGTKAEEEAITSSTLAITPVSLEAGALNSSEALTTTTTEAPTEG